MLKKTKRKWPTLLPNVLTQEIVDNCQHCKKSFSSTERIYKFFNHSAIHFETSGTRYIDTDQPNIPLQYQRLISVKKIILQQEQCFSANFSNYDHKVSPRSKSTFPDTRYQSHVSLLHEWRWNNFICKSKSIFSTNSWTITFKFQRSTMIKMSTKSYRKSEKKKSL